MNTSTHCKLHDKKYVANLTSWWCCRATWRRRRQAFSNSFGHHGQWKWGPPSAFTQPNLHLCADPMGEKGFTRVVLNTYRAVTPPRRGRCSGKISPSQSLGSRSDPRPDRGLNILVTSFRLKTTKLSFIPGSVKLVLAHNGPLWNGCKMPQFMLPVRWE